jgi:hypothetical protein
MQFTVRVNISKKILSIIATSMSLLALVILGLRPVHAQPTQPQLSNTNFTWVSASADADRYNADDRISYDGRYVAYDSTMSLLVPGDTNNASDVFVKDTQNGTIERASVNNDGSQMDGDSVAKGISSDGRYVLFNHRNPGGHLETYVRDLTNQTTVEASTDASGQEANQDIPDATSISDDGRYVVFWTNATNLTSTTLSNNAFYIKDLQTGAVDHVPFTDPTGLGHTWVIENARISADGSTMIVNAWDQTANSRTPNNELIDQVFTVNMATGSVYNVSAPSSTAPNQGALPMGVSRNGRYVLFSPTDSMLYTSNIYADAPGYTASKLGDLFLRDTQTGSLQLVDIHDKFGGDQIAAQGYCLPMTGASVSDDGRYVGFGSTATNIDSSHPESAAQLLPSQRDLSYYILDRNTGVISLIANQVGIRDDAASFAPGASTFSLMSGQGIDNADKAGRDVYLADQN